ncbi:MAG TPA: DUF3795 domain-containing protein [Candidatus Hydrogenedentes bacterium]|nr:DUF3795 domain-containing protein [Candidatus Hydrogenedentota bacterium]HIJ73073.1 DUF3795 domain-containing protein [Candidatus Hydrogenedentota bacterium]
MKPEELMTYCGLFCGTCARSAGFTAFREAATILAEVLDAHGCQYWMPDEPIDFNYAEFRKGLDFFADADSWFVCKRPCKARDDGPPFCVHECCRQHGVDVCFDCEAFPCEKTEPFKGIAERAQEYKKLGRDEWLRREAGKAAQGFEMNTGKYYQIGRTEVDPET